MDFGLWVVGCEVLDCWLCSTTRQLFFYSSLVCFHSYKLFSSLNRSIAPSYALQVICKAFKSPADDRTVKKTASPQPIAIRLQPTAHRLELTAQSPEPRDQRPEPRAHSPQPIAQCQQPIIHSPQPPGTRPQPKAQSPYLPVSLSP